MASPDKTVPLKLNLGCGQRPQAGFVNVDKFGSPDVLWDLEVFPWPWEDSSVDHVEMCHILEHLGQTVDTFFGIIKELYRVCKDQAHVAIYMPHPRHDDFLGDPTHVRPLMPRAFALFSKVQNHFNREHNYADSPLALYLDVDFVIEHMEFVADEPWLSQYRAKTITAEQLEQNARMYNNVIKEFRVLWRVIKPAATP